MKATEFITMLRTQGRYSFTIIEAEKALNLNKIATINALRRLRLKKMIVSPARGFYLILLPEYQMLGCLPAEMFISDLMNYFSQPYYIGFISAAQYYGAAHQKPQRFQVVTPKNRPAIRCGYIYIEFIANKHANLMPIKKFNTLAGTINVATPEAIAADIVNMPKHAAGINNAATILCELAPHLKIQNIIELTKLNPELFWLQRLGYLLEFLGINKPANALSKILNDKKLHWALLVSHAKYKSLQRNKKWKIIVNTNVEPDE
ncbi:MAG: type IV toxin-antitoxin system AbiEi family antitoxin [Gammaproteobacteria bacterium]|nr:type IV toxin-antitoxin system AbiEi family antitoxin [Gammaproteobacteria bacterium]